MDPLFSDLYLIATPLRRFFLPGRSPERAEVSEYRLTRDTFHRQTRSGRTEGWGSRIAERDFWQRAVETPQLWDGIRPIDRPTDFLRDGEVESAWFYWARAALSTSRFVQAKLALCRRGVDPVQRYERLRDDLRASVDDTARTLHLTSDGVGLRESARDDEVPRDAFCAILGSTAIALHLASSSERFVAVSHYSGFDTTDPNVAGARIEALERFTAAAALRGIEVVWR